MSFGENAIVDMDRLEFWILDRCVDILLSDKERF